MSSIDLCNDPIICQLLENICENVTLFSIEMLQFLIYIRTGTDYSLKDLAKLLFDFEENKRKEQKPTPTMLIDKKYNIEINVDQIRMFFFHLRCFGEYLNLIKDSPYFDPTSIYSGLNGITTATQKFVDFLKSIKKDSENVDNSVEKWIFKGLLLEYEETDVIGDYFPFTRFTPNSIKNMLIIFQHLEEDSNDVLDKLERKTAASTMASWELTGILIVICHLGKQAYDVAASGLLDQTGTKSTSLSLLLSCNFFETVSNGK